VGLVIDIHAAQLHKSGEELCGDAVGVRRTDRRTVVVLSDGLGSGVKANILATMTARIIETMLSEDVPLADVLTTVIGTLPVCQTRLIAYATFSVVVIDNRTLEARIANFDNPPPIHLSGTQLVNLEYEEKQIANRTLHLCRIQLDDGDFVGLISDGVPHAGLGARMDFGWGWDQVAKSLQRATLTHGATARGLVESLIRQTQNHYQGQVGDDASCVGLLARPTRSLMLFTGPPLNEADDDAIARRLLEFDGRKVVCGGTTGNIVARTLGTVAEVRIDTMTPTVPPIAELPGVDLVTEGILTMNQTLRLLESPGHRRGHDEPIDGAHLLANELLDADEIHLIVGQQINQYYQNPTLPREVSLRKGMIERFVQTLDRLHKRVRLEYC